MCVLRIFVIEIVVLLYITVDAFLLPAEQGKKAKLFSALTLLRTRPT